MRFTIRDVLWLTALVAMGVGWGADRHQQGQKHAKEVRQLLMKYVRAYEVKADGRLIIVKEF